MSEVNFGAASVVAYRGSQILGVPKGKRFQLPGGKRRPGESPRETAIRELLEETGLAIPPDALRPLCEAGYSKGDQGVIKHVFFVCDLSTVPCDTQGISWLTESEAKSKKIGFIFVYQKALRRYLRNRNASAA